MLSSKNHSQVIFDKKGYQDTVLLSFTATPLAIVAATRFKEIIYSLLSSKRKGFATRLCSSFVVTYWKISDVEIKGRAMKAK